MRLIVVIVELVTDCWLLDFPLDKDLLFFYITVGKRGMFEGKDVENEEKTRP